MVCIALHRNSASELRGVTRHVESQFYLPPDARDQSCPAFTQLVSWYSIYLPWRDERLSWPILPGNAPAGSRNLSITSTMPWPLHHRAPI